MTGIDILVANLADGWNLVRLNSFRAEVIQLDNRMEISARGLYRGVNVLEDLFHLGAEIVFSHQISRSVHGHLSRDVYDLAARDLGYMGVAARRLCHGIGIENRKWPFRSGDLRFLRV